MSSGDLDFKLLQVFQMLIRKRQVSAAAAALGLSQPSISRMLNKLRAYFDDPLFVRTQNSMEPTPTALALIDSVDLILQLYRSELTHAKAPVFDPATSRRVFNIVSSDVGHVILFSRLAGVISDLAPGVRLNAVSLGDKSLVHKLETGEADLAFGAYPKLNAGIQEQLLYREFYVCLLRGDHPTIRGSIDMEQYRQAQHIFVSAAGAEHFHDFMEREILAFCPEENHRFTSSNFLAGAIIAAHSNYIITAPSGLAYALDYGDRLQILKPPFYLNPFGIKQYWHERYHKDPAHQWMRKLIFSTFRKTQTLVSDLKQEGSPDGYGYQG